MIKLESAHIEEVRGIRKLDIGFEKGTFAISGPNGSGKSGVIDAIEFGITGQISRLTGRGTGSSHECMHSLRQRQVGHAVIEVPDVVTCRPESVGPVDDELGFVVQAFDRAVIDGHAEVVKDVALVAAQHPGKVAQGRQA